MVGFSFLAVEANNKGHKVEIIIYASLAILFQPLVKIHLGRNIWNFLDIVVAIGLVTSAFWKRNSIR